ncbi:MAG: hypothetical protein KatS3mg022_3593 [Armatimonadota bacterium]|nr:MAG: hypothetical protein KatS3mg022_3593 [Armatimonadota bacterium]
MVLRSGSQRLFLLLLVAVSVFSLMVESVAQQSIYLGPRRYPSLRVSVVNSGPRAATDPEAAQELIRLYGANTDATAGLWEIDHADLADSGNYGVPNNDRISVLTYLEFQVLRADANHHGGAVKEFARQNGLNHEDLYLHVAENTQLNAKRNESVAGHWRGEFLRPAWGRTVSEFIYNVASSPPWGITPLNGNNALYIGLAEPFEEMNVTISTPAEGEDGQFWIEYCDAVDENHYPTHWKTLPLLSDGTNGFRQSGKIRWIPPADWKWFFRRTTAEKLTSAYVVRIRMTGYTRYPTIDHIKYYEFNPLTTGSFRSRVVASTSTTVRLEPAWTKYETNYYAGVTVRVVTGPGEGQERAVTASSTSGGLVTLTVSPAWDVIPTTESVVEVSNLPALTIPGWDSANDRDGNGYVDDQEFTNLVNPRATARLRWHSRVPVWWLEAGSVRYRSNLWNPRVYDFWVWQINRWVEQNHIVGVRNDNMLVALDWGTYPVISGGTLSEANGGRMTDESVREDYEGRIVQAFRVVRQRTPCVVSGGNISANNLLQSRFGRLLMQEPMFNFLCMEDSLDSLMSLIALSNRYILPMYIAYGKYVEGFAHIPTTVPNSLGNAREWWEFATVSSAVIHYLFNFPDQYLGVFWNWKFVYGGLTSSSTWWKAGVPGYMAYIPTKLLSVDIGQPAGYIPEGYEPLMYREQIYVDGVSKGVYYPIGRSNESRLFVGDYSLDGSGYVSVAPTHIFYLYRQGTGVSRHGYTWPADAVLARMYTKGLVLYRCAWTIPSNVLQYATSTVRVSLPGGPYRKVNYDGTLGPPITEIDVRGFEGVVLVKVAETSNPNIQISLSVDKTNPKPLDVVTVTLEVRNTGDGEVSNVEIRVPLSNMTYERGSLSPQGYTVDTSDASTLKITVPSIAANGQITLQFRLIQRGS